MNDDTMSNLKFAIYADIDRRKFRKGLKAQRDELMKEVDLLDKEIDNCTEECFGNPKYTELFLYEVRAKLKSEDV